MAAEQNKELIIGGVFAAMGSLFALIGLWFLSDALAFDRVAVPTRGEVISVERHESRDSDTGRITYTYEPTFRYIAQDGDTYTGTTHISSSGYNFAIGTEKDLFYDPAKPGEVRLTGFWSRYGFPIMFTFGGLLFAGIGFAVLINRARRLRRGV